MTILYRAIWTDISDPETLLGDLKDGFIAWVSGKSGVDVELDDVAKVRLEDKEIEAVQATDGSTSIARLKLREDLGHEYWTTTFISMISAEGKQAWIWADVEWVDDEAFGSPPVMTAPRLVRTLLEARPGYCGSLPMLAVPTLIRPEKVEERVRLLADPLRTAPVFVVSVARGEGGAEVQSRAMTTAERLAGVASTWILPQASENAFREAVGSELHVWGGSTRCYLPGLDLDDPAPWRHRYIPPASARASKEASARWAARILAGQATARRPPELYRSKGRSLLSEVTELDYFQEAVGLEERLCQAQERIDVLELERDDALEKLTASRKEADKAARRVLYLEQSRSFGASGAAGTDDDSDVEWVPQDCREVAARVSKCFSDSIVLPESALADVDDLTTSHLAGTWALDSWEGFLALDAYVRAVRDGFSGGNFYLWAKSSNFSTSQVAMKESERVENNVRAHEARTREIDPEVEPSGVIYMGAHLKPGGVATDAPRIHFHDDVKGKTGRIHIGWFGPHLPLPKR